MRKSRAVPGRRPIRVVAIAALAGAATMAAPSLPAFAAAGTFTMDKTQIAVSGGTVVYLTDNTASNLSGITAARLIAPSTATCPTTYGGTSATSGAVTFGAGTLTSADNTSGYFTTPGGLTAGTAYGVCLYADTTNGGAVDANPDTTTGTLTAVNMGMLSAVTGQAADKPTETFPTAVLAGSTYATEFDSGLTTCPATYTTTSATVLNSLTTKNATPVNTALTVTVPTLVTGTSYLVCNYNGTTVGSSTLAARAGTTFATYTATLPTITVNPVGGSSGTATSLTATASSTAFTSATPSATLTRNSCPATYSVGSGQAEPYAATTTTKISSTKIAINVPTSVIVGGMDVTTPYNVCIYPDAVSGALLAAPGTYSVAPVLAVSAAQYATTGSPANNGSGPAQGNQAITISGMTGIPSAAAVTAGAKLTASLGGSAITNIMPISATSFSGMTSAHAAGKVALSVTTAAGTKSTTAASHYYEYTYGITVNPNTAPSGSTPVLDITGAGFGAFDFSQGITTATAIDANHAYVLLTDNAWNAQDFTTSPINAFATKSVSYCNTVLPISDTEIICTLALDHTITSVASGTTPTIAGTNVPAGAYTVTVVNAGTGLQSTQYNYSIVSSGSTFTVSPY